jgi:type I restriction enzyme S subunit
MSVSYPRDWHETTIGDVFDRISTSIDVDPKSIYEEIGIRSHGKGIFAKKPVPGVSLGEKRVFAVEPECLILNIVFAWEQAVAKTTSKEIGKVVSHRFPMYRPKLGRIDVDYALYFFKSKWGKNLLEIASPGVAGRNKTLNQSDFAELPMVLPPLAQQRRIVAVLNAWEHAVDQTERLIAAKRQRKAGLFQQLFSNLPKRPLLEAADVWFSGVDKKSRDDEAPVSLCNYVDVFHNARITAQIAFMQATASKRQIADNTLCKNDVVFTKDSETADEIAEPALVAEDIPHLVCGYHLAVARPRDGVGHGPFIAQAMRHHAMRCQFSRLANGVVRFGLTLDAMEQAEIFLPPLPIQHRIAAVLDAEDVAIEGLGKQAEALRTQNRGLMQKLLGGEWALDSRFDRVPPLPSIPAGA